MELQLLKEYENVITVAANSPVSFVTIPFPNKVSLVKIFAMHKFAGNPPLRHEVSPLWNFNTAIGDFTSSYGIGDVNLWVNITASASMAPLLTEKTAAMPANQAQWAMQPAVANDVTFILRLKFFGSITL